jgi:1,4-dihydroxy-2-naphthoate polyprenyltransferase
VTPTERSAGPTSGGSPSAPRPGPAVWIEAARPRTLSAAVAPVLVGTAAVVAVGGRVVPWRAFAALVFALAVQVAVNYANDLFDGVRGVDTADRVGPRRAVASGLVTPGQMRVAVFAALAVAAAAGLTLAAAVGPELLVVGVLAFLATLGYSGGPRPYASLGLGEVMVFVFFGLVATIGSAYVHLERVVWVAVAASVPVGLVAVQILVVNNLRDIATDAAAGKRTLAVRLGEQRTRLLYGQILPLGAVLGVVLTAALSDSPAPLGLGVAALMLAAPAMQRVREGATGQALIGALVATARTQLLLGIALALGLVLAGA